MTQIDLFLANYGYFAIFSLLMLGIVGPLIPDETILVLSGVAVHRGQLDLGLTIAVGFAGSLCGITLSYILGRTGAVYVLERYRPFQNFTAKNLPRVHLWFERYGKWTLFFGYFVAGLRHFTALTAGMSKLEPRIFAQYAYPGALVWVICFVLIGYFLGEQWETIHHHLAEAGLIAAGAAVAVGVGVWLYRRRTTSS